jgi:serine/threonine protein kinase
MVEVSRVDRPCRIKENGLVGSGLSSWVLRVDAVAKCYKRASERDREIAVYERLGYHKSILRYFGSLDGSILLQHAPHGTVRQYLQSAQHNPPLATRLRWVEQVTEAICHVHSKKIFHCDISYNNIFLDANCNAMVGDFAGSSIDEKESLGWYGTSHHHPDVDSPSEKSEIFALGSTFCELLTGTNPFQGYKEQEVENAIRNSDFPTLDHLPALRTVILKCWHGGYKTVDELLLEVKRDGTTLLTVKYIFTHYKNSYNRSLPSQTTSSYGTSARYSCFDNCPPYGLVDPVTGVTAKELTSGFLMKNRYTITLT